MYGNDNETGIQKALELGVEKEVVPEWLDLSKPRDLRVIKINDTGRVFLHFTRNIHQERTLTKNGFENLITYCALLKNKNGDDRSYEAKEYTLRSEEGNEGKDCFSFVPDSLEAETNYTVKVRAVAQGEESMWSKEAEFATPKGLWYCAWEECPDYVEEDMEYSVDEKNSRIATKTNDSSGWCTIIGNESLPQNKVTSWSVKILGSEDKWYLDWDGPF